MDKKITKINLDEKEVRPQPVESKEEKINLMNPLESNSSNDKSKFIIAFAIALAVIAGLGSGFYYARHRLLLAGAGSGTQGGVVEVGEDGVKVGQVFGAQDESIFAASEPAEGIVQPGGIGGEGSHHIERGANESQWVYITSTTIDLDKFVGTKVKVWGETVSGKKAGWLMDVGRLKVIELNAAPINEIKASPVVEE